MLVTHLSNVDRWFVNEIWDLVEIRQIRRALFLLLEGEGIKF